MNYNCPICNKLLKTFNDSMFNCENKHIIIFMTSWAFVSFAVSNTLNYVFHIEQFPHCAKLQFQIKETSLPKRQVKLNDVLSIEVPVYKKTNIITLNFYPDFSDMPKLLRKINMLRIFS